MSLVGLIVLSLALGLTAWLGFVWSVRSGQYDDPEGPKYRMLEEEEEEEEGSRGKEPAGPAGQPTAKPPSAKPSGPREG